MPLFILSLLFQVGFVIHIIKTGRSTTWIWIVITLPLAGALAYLVIEVIPGLLSSRSGRATSRKITQSMNPDKNFNDAADRYATSPSIENSIALAQEFFNKGLFTEARDLYLSCLKGIHTDDPVIIVGLIRCEFELKNFEEVKARLDKLIEKKPDYKNQEAHLLYARALESLHDTDSAQHEYETLHGYFSGPDASFYFAKFLKSTKQTDKAISIFQHILDTAKRSSKFYNTNHQEIIRQTRVELKH